MAVYAPVFRSGSHRIALAVEGARMVASDEQLHELALTAIMPPVLTRLAGPPRHGGYHHPGP